MNKLIETWKENAKKVYDRETEIMKIRKNPTKKRKYTYKYLALKQISLIENSKPKKEKTALEQMTEERKEYYEYLERVAQTNEL